MRAALLVTLTLLLVAWHSEDVLAQQVSPKVQARQAYLDAHGLEQRAEVIEQDLLAKLRTSDRVQGTPAELAEEAKEAKEDAFILALHGLNVAKIEKLQGSGISILEVTTSGPQASIVERAVNTELVIIGEVKKHVVTLIPGDGYRSSVVVEVIETLKGKAPAREIVLRQQSGLTASGKYGVEVSTDLKPKDGEKYLFFLSNALYLYRTENPGLYNLAERFPKNAPREVESERFFVAYHEPFRIEGGALQITPSLRSPTRNQTEQIFEDLRELNRILTTVQ